jgi:mRNA-degrading endonuclease RelE of RelBE toxin-antitoxin system
MFRIEYAGGVAEDLSALRAFDRPRVLDQIETQLTHTPAEETRNRKTIAGLVPPWQHKPPVWELRVGKLRVFYDVDSDEELVTGRAIRLKRPHKTTEESL